MLKANSELPGLIIRFTTDGTEPTGTSTEYKGPVAVSANVLLKSFDASGKSSSTVNVNTN